MDNENKNMLKTSVEPQSDYVLRVAIQEAGYDQAASVIRDIAFDVRPGEMIGLIGPNGAGKSTTIKTLLGLLKYGQGQVIFGGAAGRYGYVPEQPVLYEYLTLWEHLRLAAAAYEMDEADFAERAERLLSRFRLSEVKDQYPVKFSKGMKQKVMLIIGFLLEPDVYIVDEPFVGLDPHATRDFLDMLEAERQRGAGILMCTHVLDTAERVCQGFVLINKGAVVARGSLADVRVQAGCASYALLFDCFHALT